jgi:hypothetical protein
MNMDNTDSDPMRVEGHGRTRMNTDSDPVRDP